MWTVDYFFNLIMLGIVAAFGGFQLAVIVGLVIIMTKLDAWERDKEQGEDTIKPA